MQDNNNIEFLNIWLSLNKLQTNINDELEHALQENYSLSLNEFLVLYFLSQTEEKKLRLQQLQEMVGLSQSALSRLVVRMEAKSCGALQRHICEDDRRGIYTSMTDFGEKKFDKALETFNQVLESTLLKNGLKQKLQSLIEKI
ncbi:MarR family transcriptional regulator [Paenibacillus sp. CMAA1739]|uniref:MarR family winged helix-turn-helix transcriptional regulator n=1 Tax=Paenibacillus ottowii TaxID=2315729 RepID=UPI002731ECC4|nr:MULTISPECIES: MarR family transcriptional regulator [Paenibacillus]MDP1513150.1 MarR family transcriptional regulator [Paenibacillus ottowii]MEC4569131.1 MarR family transcriptional regulator [Paenibacillus sp. CMAA1739]